MHENSTHFIQALITGSEELHKFPIEFVEVSLKWIRAWFMKDDPIIEAVLVSKGNFELKRKVIEAKLPELEQNKQFVQELGKRLADYESMKNVILKSKLDVKRDAHIGDNGKAKEESDRGIKNAIIGSEVKVGGNLHVGDHHTHKGIEHTGNGDIIIGDKIVTIHGSAGQSPNLDKNGIKANVRAYIAKGDLEEAINQLVDFMDAKGHQHHDESLQLSGRYHALKSKERRGIISGQQASLETNKIRASLLDLLGIV
jgi:hypothetical protein